MRDLKAHLLRQHGRILRTHQKIIVGVSGGADSMALLHLLLQILGRSRIIVAHLDHGWREQSQDDAAFVRTAARQSGVPFHARRLDERADSGLEAAGRLARYRLFGDVARCEGATAVAVAHHADDQAETVLLHLMRGSGLDGMGGMAAETPLVTDSDVRLIRPLLNVRRSEIEAYCTRHQLPFVIDPSNVDTRFLRNRVRHEILPLLTQANPGIVSHLTTLATLVQDDTALLAELTQQARHDCLIDQGEGWIRLHSTSWQKLSPALRRRLLRDAALLLNPQPAELSFAAVEAARLGLEQGHFGARYDLTADILLEVEGETFLLRRRGVIMPIDLPLLPEERLDIGPKHAFIHQLVIPGVVDLADGWRLTAAYLDRPDIPTLMQNQDRWQAHVSPRFDTLTVRARQEGERIRPLGMNGASRSLKKLMMERRIPVGVRHRWPVVASKEHAVWLAGITLDHRARLRGDEKKVLRLVIEKGKP